MKVISLRLPEELFEQLKMEAKVDERSFNSFVLRKLQSDTKVIPQVIEKDINLEDIQVGELCSCGERADYESEQDWETGEVKFFCEKCIWKKAGSEKQFKILTSKMKKL